MISVPVEKFWMESRESIIADLRRLGMEVNQILSYRPTDIQLKDEERPVEVE